MFFVIENFVLNVISWLENLAGDAIALNSFNTNMLLTLKEAASEAETDEELNEIRNRLHNLTDCKPNNQGFMP